MAKTRQNFHDAVRVLLKDPDQERYSESLLDEALREAVSIFSMAFPLGLVVTFDVPQTSNELSLAEWMPVHQFVMLWYPFDEDDTELAPLEDVHFYRPNGIPTLRWKGGQFEQGQSVQVYFSSAHTIAGLDDAEATTIPRAAEEAIRLGMAGFAAQARSAQLIEQHGALSMDQKAMYDLGLQWVAGFEKRCKKLRSAAFSPYGPLPEGGWKLEDYRTTGF
jgi:hypothetical protein